MITITTPRAILDWINKPKTLEQHEREQARLGEGAEVEQKTLPGVIGRTRFRVTWELDQRTAPALMRKIDEALADEKISDSMRNAIEATKRQLETECAELLQEVRHVDPYHEG